MNKAAAQLIPGPDELPFAKVPGNMQRSAAGKIQVALAEWEMHSPGQLHESELDEGKSINIHACGLRGCWRLWQV
jgi:hypothetical protein